MCGLITVSNLYGVQEHPFSEDSILRFYKHPFLQFLNKSSAKPKQKVHELVENIEINLEIAQSGVKKGQPIQELLLM